MHSSTPWVSQARCTPDDTPLFFPESGHDEDYEQARAICDLCPVARQCTEFAITRGIRWGMFGGKTPSERETYRRKNKIVVTHSQRILSPHGTAGAYSRHTRKGEKICPECSAWKTIQRKGA